jgi:peptide/nickel transport system substrate-binding protein
VIAQQPRVARGRLAAAIALLSVLWLGVAHADTLPRHGGILEYAVDTAPSNYDCEANFSFVANHVLAPEYSTLLKFDTARYPEIVGDLAQSWRVSPDRMTYTFTLEPGVLFHDGSHLTSADVKATYERIIHPPTGVLSARQADYAAIAQVDTPNERTVVFHLQWPDAAMLANLASPWNCIYSAQRLKQDPDYPKAHVMGTGPFVFVGHEKGGPWVGKRWVHYFRPGHPYLDGFRADFMSGPAVLKAMEAGRVMTQFRSFTPVERDELVRRMGDRVAVYESPWITYLALVFNTREKPFSDARVRRALSLAIDRWQMADDLSRTTFLKYVGGLMRPGTAMSTPASELVTLPGFSRDIGAARMEARRLLAAAGVPHLTLTLTNRNDVPIPYGPAGDYLIEAWKAIGVEAKQEMLPTKGWQGALEQGHFAVALDLAADYFDDPTIQLARYISRDLSPLDHAQATDRFLDALFIGQAISPDVRRRAATVRGFENQALTDAATVPILWWNRIIVTSVKMKGWNMSPSHYIGQDLGDVWIESGAVAER